MAHQMSFSPHFSAHLHAVSYPMDCSVWFEVFLGEQWCAFDPRSDVLTYWLCPHSAAATLPTLPSRRPSVCVTLCHAPSGPMQSPRRGSDNHGHHHRTAS